MAGGGWGVGRGRGEGGIHDTIRITKHVTVRGKCAPTTSATATAMRVLSAVHGDSQNEFTFSVCSVNE